MFVTTMIRYKPLWTITLHLVMHGTKNWKIFCSFHCRNNTTSQRNNKFCLAKYLIFYNVILHFCFKAQCKFQKKLIQDSVYSKRISRFIYCDLMLIRKSVFGIWKIIFIMPENSRALCRLRYLPNLFWTIK